MSEYIGVNNVAREITQKYVGVNNVAREIKEEYVGVNNTARLVYSSEYWSEPESADRWRISESDLSNYTNGSVVSEIPYFSPSNSTNSYWNCRFTALDENGSSIPILSGDTVTVSYIVRCYPDKLNSDGSAASSSAATGKTSTIYVGSGTDKNIGITNPSVTIGSSVAPSKTGSQSFAFTASDTLSLKLTAYTHAAIDITKIVIARKSTKGNTKNFTVY